MGISKSPNGFRIYFPSADLEEVLTIQQREHNEKGWVFVTPIKEEIIDGYCVIDIGDMYEAKYDVRVLISNKKNKHQHQQHHLYEVVGEDVYGKISVKFSNLLTC